jgi:hypothetical protein
MHGVRVSPIVARNIFDEVSAGRNLIEKISNYLIEQ